MRFLIFISVCISSAFAFHLNSYSSHSARSIIPDVQLRSKRDIRLRSLDDPDNCIRNCANAAQIDFNKSLNDTDDEGTKARKRCRALEPIDICYQSCPDSKLRTLTIDNLPMLKLLCFIGSDKAGELKKTMKCLNATNVAVANKCDRICNNSFSDGSPLLIGWKYGEAPYIYYDIDKKKNADSLSAMCKINKCEQRCGASIMKKRCGQSGVDVDRKSRSIYLGVLIKIFKDFDALEGSIEECDSFL